MNEADNYNRLGNACVENKDLAGAIENYTRAIELGTKKEAVYNNRGQAFAVLGQHEEAIADLEKFLKLKSGHRFASLVEKEIKALAAPNTRVYLSKVTQSSLQSCLCGAGGYSTPIPVYNITAETDKGTINFQTTEFHGKYSPITIYVNQDTEEVTTSGYLLLES